jgi:hypothetical protein
MRKVDFKLLFTALTEFLDDEKNSNNIVGQELAIRLILERQSESYERQQVFDLLIAIIDRTKGSEAILPTASNGLELLIRRDNNLVLFGVGSDFVVNSLVGRPSEKVWRAIMSYMNGWDFRLLYALSLNPDIGAEIKAEVMKKLDAALDVALPTIRHKDESSYWRMRHWGVGVVPYCMTFAQRSKLTDSQRKEYKSYSADPDAFLFVLRTYALELIGWNADPNDKSVVEFLEGVIKDETGLYTAEHKAQAAASIKMLKERAVVKSGEMYSEKWIQAQVMDAWQKTEGVELKEAVKKLNLSISYEDALNEMNGNNVDEAEKPAIDRSEIKSTIQGGIDMNDIQISGADAQSGIQFDPAMMDRALNAKVDGFAAVVVSMTPVDNVLLLLK